MSNLIDSGVQWIGKIPKDWKLIHFKNKYSNKKEIAGSRASDYERIALTLNGVIKRPKDDSEGLQPKDFDTYQILEANDFVFKMIDLQNISTSRVGLSPYTGLVSPAYLRFSPKDPSENTRFMHYYLMSLYYNCVFNSLGGDGVRSSLSAKDMGQIMCPYPNVSIQKKIVEFLDKKSSQIDELIAIQEQEIEKLQAYKHSLITEVVTKGLDPNVEMKNSGIQFIGEVPVRWKTPKVLFCLEMPITDGPHTTPVLYDEGVPFVSAEAVSSGNGVIDFSHIRGYISEEFYEECCKKYIPKIDDIYMIKSGATTGKVAIVDTYIKFNIWSPLGVFRCDKDVVIPKYLFYYLQSDNFQKQVQLGWTYGTQQNIGMRTLEKLVVAIPELDEQTEITNFLDSKCKQIDNLVSIKKHKIDSLNDYRRSLIYEYVTGKKEVSNV